MELLREYAGSRWGRIFGRLAPARARAHAVWQEIEGRKS